MQTDDLFGQSLQAAVEVEILFLAYLLRYSSRFTNKDCPI